MGVFCSWLDVIDCVARSSKRRAAARPGASLQKSQKKQAMCNFIGEYTGVDRAAPRRAGEVAVRIRLRSGDEPVADI